MHSSDDTKRGTVDVFDSGLQDFREEVQHVQDGDGFSYAAKRSKAKRGTGFAVGLGERKHASQGLSLIWLCIFAVVTIDKM